MSDVNNVSGKRKFLDSNIVRLFLVLFLLCVCAALGAGIAVYEDRSNPTKYVAEYFGKFLMQKYEDMYEYVDVKDAFVPKDVFVSFMKELREQNDIGEYEFEEPAVSDDGRYYVRVSFDDVSTGEKKHLDIFLNRKKGIISNVIADWKISIEDYVADNFIVSIPSNMHLVIDGTRIEQSEALSAEKLSNVITNVDGETVVINPEKLINSTDEVSTYRFDRIIMGSHNLQAIGSYNEIIRTADVRSSNTVAELKLEDRVIKEGYEKQLRDNASLIIQEYYNVVKDRKTGSKTLWSYFKDEKKAKKSVQKLIEKDTEVIFWPEVRHIEEYSLSERKFSDIKMETSYEDDGKFYVTCSYSYNYTSSTEASMSTSYVAHIRGKCTAQMKLGFQAVSGGVKVVSMSIKNKNQKSE